MFIENIHCTVTSFSSTLNSSSQVTARCSANDPAPVAYKDLKVHTKCIKFGLLNVRVNFLEV